MPLKDKIYMLIPDFDRRVRTGKEIKAEEGRHERNYFALDFDKPFLSTTLHESKIVGLFRQNQILHTE
jgi:hypothetical protein